MSEKYKNVELKNEDLKQVNGGETSGSSLFIKVSKGYYKENDVYYYLDTDCSDIIGGNALVNTIVYSLHSTMGMKYIKYTGEYIPMYISKLAAIGRVPDEEVPPVNVF